MHTERLVPLDDQARNLVSCLLAYRDRAPALARESSPFLLLNKKGNRPCWKTMITTLRKAARAAGCSIQRITTHQLRHSFAIEMLRGGASLPAVKALLGHAKIDMTLRYIEVSQLDLQREYRQARANLGNVYQFPNLNPTRSESVHPYVRARQHLADAAHFLEMQRRRLSDPKQDITLRRL
jgi:integrase/recombinase XerD